MSENSSKKIGLKDFLSGLGTVAKIGLGAVLIVLLVLLAKGVKTGGKKLFGRHTKISEVVLEELRSTQKLKVLTMYREVMINMYKPSSQRFASSDDQLCIIYPARLDFGYDFDKLSSEDIRLSGDTLHINLPPIEILNKDGESLDEASKRVPIQNGFWTASEKAAHRRFAKAEMLLECEDEGCWEQAAELGEAAISNLLQSLGLTPLTPSSPSSGSLNATTVSIKAANSRRRLELVFGKALPKIIPAKPTNTTNGYKIKRAGDRLYYMKYNNGATLMCTGELNEEMMLRLARLLSDMPAGSLTQVSLSGNTTNVYFINEKLSRGSASALKHVREINAQKTEPLLKAIMQISGSSELKAYEMDKDHNVMYTYPNT